MAISYLAATIVPRWRYYVAMQNRTYPMLVCVAVLLLIQAGLIGLLGISLFVRSIQQTPISLLDGRYSILGWVEACAAQGGWIGAILIVTATLLWFVGLCALALRDVARNSFKKLA